MLKYVICKIVTDPENEYILGNVITKTSGIMSTVTMTTGRKSLWFLYQSKSESIKSVTVYDYDKFDWLFMAAEHDMAFLCQKDCLSLTVKQVWGTSTILSMLSYLKTVQNTQSKIQNAS